MRAFNTEKLCGLVNQSHGAPCNHQGQMALALDRRALLLDHFWLLDIYKTDGVFQSEISGL